MSENLKKSEIEGAPELAVGVPPLGNLSATALARRKMLLTSLGKGSAVVAAAALPLKALAATPTVTSINGIGLNAPVRCTISGMQSGVHSKETIRTTCAGRKPSSYGTPAFPANTNWPGNLSRTTAFNVVFPTSPETNTLTSIIQGAPGSDNAYWIAAFLNALSGLPVTNFPYTPTEVQGLFVTNPGPALLFFKTYMSTL